MKELCSNYICKSDFWIRVIYTSKKSAGKCNTSFGSAVYKSFSHSQTLHPCLLLDCIFPFKRRWVFPSNTPMIVVVCFIKYKPSRGTSPDSRALEKISCIWKNVLSDAYCSDLKNRFGDIIARPCFTDITSTRYTIFFVSPSNIKSPLN